MDEPTFQDLIGRVRAGDADAARELVQRYEPAIRRAVRVRLVDPRLRRLLDSTDICQSVFGSFFVRAVLGEYDLQEPQQLLNLLIAMSQKKLIDRQRRDGAERRDYRRIEGAGRQLNDIPQDAETPSQQLAAQELLSEFRKRLSPDERRLADDRAQGRDWAQIAAREGTSAEALRKKLIRAVDRVAQELQLDEGP